MCTLLAEAMKAYPEDAHVLELACRAIVVLTCSEDDCGNGQRLGSAGVCKLVVTAILSHRQDRCLLAKGLMALAYLGRDHDNKWRLGEGGAFNVVLSTWEGLATAGSGSKVGFRGCSLAHLNHSLSLSPTLHRPCQKIGKRSTRSLENERPEITARPHSTSKS